MNTISVKEAQRYINAISRQRDEHANARAQAEAALEAEHEASIEKDRRIKELEEQLKVLQNTDNRKQ